MNWAFAFFLSVGYLAVGVLASVLIRRYMMPNSPHNRRLCAAFADWSVILWPLVIIMIGVVSLMVFAEYLAEKPKN